MSKSFLLPKFILLAVCLGTVSGCARSGRDKPDKDNAVLRIAVTTSTRDSGLLDLVLPPFEERFGARVDVIAAGTGNALKLGEGGDVDAVWVHARELEDAFMAARHGIRREDVMHNNFVLLGPGNDPAGVRELPPEEGLRRIRQRQAPFVSRGDNSGTHYRELSLWAAAGGLEPWSEYIETGQGQGETLVVANEKQAYVLSDRGTYLKRRGQMNLVPLAGESELLRNDYGVLVVNPARRNAASAPLAHTFVDYLISPETQELIGSYKIDGEALFFPRYASATETDGEAVEAASSSPRGGMAYVAAGVRDAFGMIFTLDAAVMDAAFRSVWITCSAIALAVLAGVPLGMFLAHARFAGRRALVVSARAAMAVPTVFIGVICFAIFNRGGPLGLLEILFTPWAIIIGEFLLALPIIISWTHNAVSSLDPRVAETARVLGAGKIRRARTYLSEARAGVVLGILTAFARCVTELGVALIVGGNIPGRTRTLATSAAMANSQGEFARGLAMGFLLLCISLGVTCVIARLGREQSKE